MEIVKEIALFLIYSAVYAAMGMPFALVAVHFATRQPRRNG